MTAVKNIKSNIKTLKVNITTLLKVRLAEEKLSCGGKLGKDRRRSG